MQRLRFLMLGAELLARPLEVVEHRQDLAQGAAGDLQAQIVVVPALTLAEVVEISSQTHVLAVEVVVLGPQGTELGFQLGNALGGRVGLGRLGLVIRGRRLALGLGRLPQIAGRLVGALVVGRLGNRCRCLQIRSDTGFGAHRRISTHG